MVAPAAQLAARPRSHWSNAAVLGIAGVAGTGRAMGHGAWGVRAAGGVVLVAVAVTGSLAHRRSMVADRLLEALAPTLGIRQLDRRVVSLSRWTRLAGAAGHDPDPICRGDHQGRGRLA